MPDYLIALGSNQPTSLGGAAATLNKATECIISGYSLYVKSVSRQYETLSFPDETEPKFVNSTLVLRSELMPHHVLAILHAIEAQFGRRRDQRWAPRTLDLDLLLVGDVILPNALQVRTWMDKLTKNGTVPPPPFLTIPHPRMHERGFVLGPARDIARDWTHPILERTVDEMWWSLPEESRTAVTALP